MRLLPSTLSRSPCCLSPPCALFTPFRASTRPHFRTRPNHLPLPRAGQLRLHGSHGHDHHHHQAEIKTLSDPGSRITLIGMASNVVLTAGKAWAGVHYGSSALLADALHSLSDMISDVVTLFTLRLSSLPPSPRFPNGLAKAEPLGTLVVSSLLLAGGTGVGWESCKKLLALSGAVAHAHGGEVHGAVMEAGDIHPTAFWIALGTIVAKEALFRATLGVAKKQGSDVLVAQAWHHRSDSLSTLVAVIGVGGSMAGFPALDPLGGILVSLLVMRAGLGTLRSSTLSLLDAASPPPPQLLPILTSTIPGLQRESVRTRRVGLQTVVEVEAFLPGRTTLDDAERTVEGWKDAVRRQWEEVGEGRDMRLDVRVRRDVEVHA